jgi:hypothetical protein
VPPPPWQPPKQRGRRSKQLHELIERWAVWPRLSAELPRSQVRRGIQPSGKG